MLHPPSNTLLTTHLHLPTDFDKMVRSRDEKQAYFNRLKDYIETYRAFESGPE